MNDIRTAAIALHEMLISLIDAGFTRAEAVELVKAQLVTAISQN